MEKLLVVVANEMKRIAGILNACMKMKLTIRYLIRTGMQWRKDD